MPCVPVSHRDGHGSAAVAIPERRAWATKAQSSTVTGRILISQVLHDALPTAAAVAGAIFLSHSFDNYNPNPTAMHQDLGAFGRGLLMRMSQRRRFDPPLRQPRKAMGTQPAGGQS
jgi:hypothetical protein